MCFSFGWLTEPGKSPMQDFVDWPSLKQKAPRSGAGVLSVKQRILRPVSVWESCFYIGEIWLWWSKLGYLGLPAWEIPRWKWDWLDDLDGFKTLAQPIGCYEPSKCSAVCVKHAGLQQSLKNCFVCPVECPVAITQIQTVWSDMFEPTRARFFFFLCCMHVWFRCKTSKFQQTWANLALHKRHMGGAHCEIFLVSVFLEGGTRQGDPPWHVLHHTLHSRLGTLWTVPMRRAAIDVWVGVLPFWEAPRGGSVLVLAQKAMFVLSLIWVNQSM